MAGYRCCLIFLAWLLITIVLHSLKPNRGFDKTSCSIAVSTGLDIKQYPTRNSGPTRRFLREALVPPSLKCMAALKFANITVCATYMVLLAGDIQENPGPVTDACAVCTKGCRKNQMAIQCDSCDKWFHAKCISMKRTEYDKLCEPSLAWECITCLSPGFDTPVRKSHETTNTGVKEGKPSVRINKDLHANLKKRGMKFAHVNIATLPRHHANAKVLMEKAALDVFAVTESCLDCTLLDSKICPSGHTCYRKDRNRNGGGCAVFVRSKWPSKRRSDLESDCLEMVCVEICPEKAKNTIFAVMYKPPSMNQEKFILGLEQEFLAKLDDEMVKDLIIMGDFNADVIALKPCKYTRKLMQTTRLHGLSQLVRAHARDGIHKYGN